MFMTCYGELLMNGANNYYCELTDTTAILGMIVFFFVMTLIIKKLFT